MSIQGAPDMESVLRERGGQAYVVTVSEQGGPHAVYVPVRWEHGALVAEVGPTTARNAAARPRVSVLYPVRTDGEYSLIVDGAAIVEPGGEAPRLRVTPSKVVLHRPGPSPDPTSSCGADCVPLPVPVMPGRR